jgi:23S rRNA (guanine745-N1)-methyltransferase
MLACTVRGCGLALERRARSLRCARGHSFDIARSGYINLLQPQDRRSKHPGDSAEVVAARRRLHERGLTAPLLDGLERFCALRAAEAVVEAGCGEGFYLGSLQARSHCQAQGIDISIAAIDAAARRWPHCQWVVANADRRIPDTDASFDVVLSITGRRHPSEFWRVLRPGGRLILALPAPGDLAELCGPGRDRVPSVLEEFVPYFLPEAQERITATAELDEQATADLLLAIYRPRQPQPARAGKVTFSLDLLRLGPRPPQDG